MYNKHTKYMKVLVEIDESVSEKYGRLSFVQKLSKKKLYEMAIVSWIETKEAEIKSGLESEIERIRKVDINHLI